ncbi:MAG: hypothetical protein ACTHY6_13415, partial [Corynebacterium variabile]
SCGTGPAKSGVHSTRVGPGGDGDGSTTLRIATVDNPDLERLREFSDAFTNEHPDVTIDWVVQDENRIR